MREIKFRGRRKDNGEWVYGVPVETSISGVYMVSAKTQSKGGKGGIVIRDVIVQYEVIPATVGQFSGLHDKNGVEIYEGDIVKTFHGKIAVVRYGFYQGDDLLQQYKDHYVDSWGNSRKDHGFYVATVENKERYGFDSRTDLWLEIIGNIHEHPNLLESDAP